MTRTQPTSCFLKLALLGVLSAFLAIAPGCGQAPGTQPSTMPDLGPPQPPADMAYIDPGAHPSALVVADDTVASETIAAQLETAVDALGEDAGDAAVAAMIAPLAGKSGLAPSFQCMVDMATGNVVVTRDVSGADTLTLHRQGGDVTDQIQISQHDTQTWVKAPKGEAVACGADGRLALHWGQPLNISGLTLAATGTFQRIDSVTSGTTMTQRSATRNGMRNVTFGLPVVAPDLKTDTGTKTISLALDQSIVTQHGGKNVTLSVHVQTPASGALQEVVVRTAGKAAWLTKTISQGEVDSVLADGGQVQLVYSGVGFASAAAVRCLPTTGTISGKVLDKSGAVLRTFTIQFGAGTPSGASIAFGGASGPAPGAARDFPHFRPVGCAL